MCILTTAKQRSKIAGVPKAGYRHGTTVEYE